MNEYYLAIDIGASSGRHILGQIVNGRLVTEEIYRFPNGFRKSKSGHLSWDIDRLFSEILHGLTLCSERGTVPCSIGIDSWGVDFVLLDETGNRIGESVAYRDCRTDGMDAVAERIIPFDRLYRRTGTQKQTFNTIYQLLALKKEHPEQLAAAKQLLFIPDYLHYLLTGVVTCEYTIASTSGLLNAPQKNWDYALIERLGLPTSIFLPLSPAGSRVATLLPEIEKQIGFTADVTLPACHDTASAVLAVPSLSDDVLYLSSGTWSLMGVERDDPDTSDEALSCNFTNEGGFDGRYRFLKNIMGLWILQSLRRETGLSFGQMMELAESNLATGLRLNVNDSRLLSPISMEAALRSMLPGFEPTLGELIAAVYHSLADCYHRTVLELERRTGVCYPTLQIIGGGCKDELLNRLTANACGREVIAGPAEATAIGNLTAQMIGRSALPSVRSARELIQKSTETVRFLPESSKSDRKDPD